MQIEAHSQPGSIEDVSRVFMVRVVKGDTCFSPLTVYCLFLYGCTKTGVLLLSLRSRAALFWRWLVSPSDCIIQHTSHWSHLFSCTIHNQIPFLHFISDRQDWEFKFRRTSGSFALGIILHFVVRFKLRFEIRFHYFWGHLKYYILLHYQTASCKNLHFNT